MRQQALLPWERESPVIRYRGGRLAPVLLIPGVYETWQFMRPVGDYLHGLGHPVHALAELGYNRKSIAATAALAQSYLDANDLHDVILIGHSKGGIIGKHMMVADDVSGRIAQLIAVNSPFAGSSLARFAPNPALRVFDPRNELIVTLAGNVDINARITSIYSRLDPIIPGGSRLDGATNIELPMVGHFTPLGSPDLFREVGRAIAAR
jgi:pimeloyl-ACP methyl ester carboxylesterase